MHHYVRKVFPFLYERNWYNGKYEFSHHRALLFAILLLALLLLGVYLWSLGKPIEYVR